MKNCSRILSLVLSLIMIVGFFNVLPVSVSASVIDFSGSGEVPDEGISEIHLGEGKTVKEGQTLKFKFIPDEDTLIWADTDTNLQPLFIYLYDENMELLAWNDFFCFVESGKTYYLHASCNKGDEFGYFRLQGKPKEIHVGDEIYFGSGRTFYKFSPDTDTILWADSERFIDIGVLVLYDADFQQLKTDSIHYAAKAGKDYYICSRGSWESDSFTITLEGNTQFEEMHIGDTKTVNITKQGEKVYFKFVPEKDMPIKFSSDNTDGYVYAHIYDNNFSQIKGHNGWNFNLISEVKANQIYWLDAEYSYETIGSFTVTLSEPPVWEYTRNGLDSIEITRYNGFDSELVVPEEISGYTVTSIGYEAFENCQSIISVEIPDTVKTIGRYAFCSCNNLKTVKLPAYIKTIGERVFYECSSLDNITLPDGITRIGAYAFHGCGKLKSLNFPDGLVSIGDSAFWFCYNLSDVVLPNTVEEIGFGAFMDCDSLKEVTIGYGVFSIGNMAFGYFDVPDMPKADLTIKGYTGSAAEEYAVNNDFTFVSLGQAPPKPTLSFTPKYQYEYIENYNGHWEIDDLDGSKSYVYYSPDFYDGDKLTITYSDERGAIEYYYNELSFVDANGNMIDESDVKWSGGSGWTVGGKNSFKLTYKNMSIEVPVKLVKPQNSSIQFVPSKPYELIENRDGYMAGNYFRYYLPNIVKGDKIILNNGGKAVTYTYSTDDYGFFDEDGQRLPYKKTSDQSSTPWTLGSDNYFIIIAAGKTALVPVTIIEYPVASIEFKLASPIIVYENQDGFYYSENGARLYNDENGYYYYDYSGETTEKIYTEPKTFRYNQLPVYKDGNQLIIHNKDGSTKTLTQRFIFTEEDHGYFFVDENGNYDNNVGFTWEDQDFTLGSNNRITVTYLDNTTTIPFTLVQNNIESIEYQPIKPIVFNIDDPKDVYIDESGHDYGFAGRIYYNPQITRETGSAIIARFKDGTTKRYVIYSTSTIKDGKYNPVIGSRYWIVDEEGSVIGYSSLQFDYNTTDWTAGNTYDLTVRYLGATTKVPIKVIKGEADTSILGDADGDGKVTIVDATCIQRHLAGLPTKAFIEKAANADEDAKVTILDATAIQRHLAGLPTNNNIGKPIA